MNEKNKKRLSRQILWMAHKDTHCLMLLSLSMQAEEVYATFSVQADQSANLAFTSSGIVNYI